MKRRDFLKLTGVAGGGLVLGFSFTGGALAQAAPVPVELNAYIQIRPDGMIRIYNPNPEIGQGVKTSLPLIVAEELDAAWESVVVEQAPINPVYGRQFAGGSLATPMMWMPLRQAGAAARSMLVAAAADAWAVGPETLRTENNAVINPANNERLTYAQLAEKAATMPVPDPATLVLKERSQWKLLGKRVTGVDNQAIVTGKPLFGIDAAVPGMKYATYVRAPRLGSKLVRANIDEVKALPGVTGVYAIEGLDPISRTLVPGVAVVANSTWEAFEAAKKVRAEWDETDASTDDSASFLAFAKEAVQRDPDKTLSEVGDFAAAFEAAPTKVEGFYDYPFLYHSPLEPMNCTASYTADGKVEVWAPTQLPGSAITDVAAAVGVEPANVTMHVLRNGGGFGRRLFNDFACEAAAISKVAGVPIKLTYPREMDTPHGLYRPAGYHSLKGALDADGKLVGIQDHFVTFKDRAGNVVFAGDLSAWEFPMLVVPNGKMMQTEQTLTARSASFRAPSSNGIAFATQSFFHELSTAAGRDHKEFLLELLGEPRDLRPPRPANAPAPPPGAPAGPAFNTGRMANVINAVCDKAEWGRAMPAGSGLGLAFYYSHQGHIASVVEVSVDSNKKITIHKVWVAADVGPVVNLSAAENQVQGATIDGLGLTANLAITMSNGVIQQTNYHNYPLIRLSSAPLVDVTFLDSDYSPTGLGEPALPPAIPAFCNAIFAATGERVRSLPLTQHGFSI
jgi:isoquinoline 1-oxidoreductase beta subunit